MGSNQYIQSSDIFGVIKNELSSITKSLCFISAFCKQNVLQCIDELLVGHSIEKELVVRFKLSDILAGVTDFSIIEYCRNNSWTLRILINLHAKTYIFDNKRILVGSGNLTRSGLGMSGHYNEELFTLSDIPETGASKIKRLFEDAIEISDELKTLMSNQMDIMDDSNDKNAEWTGEIVDLLDSGISTLLIEDFAYVNLLDSKPYKWVKHLLSKHNGNASFGEITKELHNSLVNEPVPYRKTVKELLAKLIKDCKESSKSEILIEQPNHSQILTLCKLPGK